MSTEVLTVYKRKMVSCEEELLFVKLFPDKMRAVRSSLTSQAIKAPGRKLKIKIIQSIRTIFFNLTTLRIVELQFYLMIIPASLQLYISSAVKLRRCPTPCDEVTDRQGQGLIGCCERMSLAYFFSVSRTVFGKDHHL